MKKLMYLFVAGTMFAFVACGGGDTTTEEAAPAAEEVVACADDCLKACCLGCKAKEGDKKCIVLEDGSMPCCIEKTEDAEEAHDHGPEGHSH
jgi:hypothetical protein